MTEADRTDLRQRRAARILDADPLLTFQQERARLYERIEEITLAYTRQAALDTREIEGLRSQLEEAQEARRAAFQGLLDAVEAKAERAQAAEALAGMLLQVLMHEPELVGVLPTTLAERASSAIRRLINDRNAAVDEVGRVMALLDRLRVFVNTCRQLEGDQAESIRAEAARLHAAIFAQDDRVPCASTAEPELPVVAGNWQGISQGDNTWGRVSGVQLVQPTAKYQWENAPRVAGPARSSDTGQISSEALVRLGEHMKMWKGVTLMPPPKEDDDRGA